MLDNSGTALGNLHYQNIIIHFYIFNYGAYM